jgi:thymidine phosphorylase
VRALLERAGEARIGYALLRAYWKPLATVAGALVAFGVFLHKFDTMIEGQAGQTKAIEKLTARVAAVETQQAVLASQYGVLAKGQNDEETRWKEVITAADIVVSPRAPKAKRQTR